MGGEGFGELVDQGNARLIYMNIDILPNKDRVRLANVLMHQELIE